MPLTGDTAEILSTGTGPLYMQVRKIMIDRIGSGQWKPGAPLPSETSLAKEFEVSHGTVRKAVDSLVAQKLVVRHQGRGTYVTKHSRQRSLFYFFHIVNEQNEKELPNSKVISLVKERATAEQVRRLDLKQRSYVYDLLRVRYLESRPTLLERIILPSELFPVFELPIGVEMSEELYVYYEQNFGVSIARAEDRLSAVASDEVAAEHLKIRLNEPLLKIERIAYTLDNKPVEWRTGFCSSNNHKYLVYLA